MNNLNWIFRILAAGMACWMLSDNISAFKASGIKEPSMFIVLVLTVEFFLTAFFALVCFGRIVGIFDDLWRGGKDLAGKIIVFGIYFFGAVFLLAGIIFSVTLEGEGIFFSMRFVLCFFLGTACLVLVDFFHTRVNSKILAYLIGRRNS